MGEADSKKEIRRKIEQKQHQQHLIPGLPSDIAMECLIRVPYQFHSTMKAVCQGWRSLIAQPSFYRERRKLGTAEHLVCLVQALPPPPPPPPADSTIVPSYCFNDTANITVTANCKEVEDEKRQLRQLHSPPLYGLSIFNASFHSWHRIMPNCGFGSGIPMFCHCVALPSAGKLLLLGGWNPETLEPLPDVYILDFMGGGGGGAWFKRAAPMSVGRSFFACAAVGPSTVYVAGGHDNQKNALRSAEVYDVEADEWRTLPAMEEERDECQGLCWEGDSKFWVVSGYGTESQGRFRSDAECYDPATGSWSRVDGVWPFPSISPRGTTAAFNSSGGGNHCQWWWFLRGEEQLQQQQNGEEREVNESCKEKNWMVVNSIPLPEGIVGSSPCVTSLGGDDRMFVMGGGGGGGRGSSSSLSSAGAAVGCDECDGEGAFVLEKDSSGTNKWSHIHTPPNFAGFPYSASYLRI